MNEVIVSTPTALNFTKIGELFEQTCDFEKGKEFYEKAINLNSKDSETIFKLGKILEEIGEPSKAIDYFKKAI